VVTQAGAKRGAGWGAGVGGRDQKEALEVGRVGQGGLDYCGGFMDRVSSKIVVRSQIESTHAFTTSSSLNHLRARGACTAWREVRAPF
jgi:hypothetical protein